jgi:LAO/AO transport system kinase
MGISQDVFIPPQTPYIRAFLQAVGGQLLYTLLYVLLHKSLQVIRYHTNPMKRYAVQELVDGILEHRTRICTNQDTTGYRRFLAKAISLVESTRSQDAEAAQELVECLLPHTGASLRLGITGVPGVGKSTFIEAFGLMLVQQAHHVAVLAVDPSSKRTGGSILGDKTRMNQLSRAPQAFIRPSPAGTTLGGVAQRTRESLLLCEAAGFDVLLVETVGVGQSETAVASMVDMFLMLLLPNAGDELQGIKRGIMELADAFIINKADTDKHAAERAAAHVRNAAHLSAPKYPDWQPAVLLTSALEQTGMREVWSLCQEFAGGFAGNRANSASAHATTSGTLLHPRIEHLRRQQAVGWMNEAIARGLQAMLDESEELRRLRTELQAAVLAQQYSPTLAAQRVLQAFEHIMRQQNTGGNAA